MLTVTRHNGKCLVLFPESEVAQIRAKMRRSGLPEHHWVQVDLSPSGTFIAVHPPEVREPALTLLVYRARRELRSQ